MADSSVRVLWGDALAEEAAHAAQRIDPEQRGLDVGEIRAELERTRIRIRGDNPVSVLRSAMNRNQHIWDRIDRGVWCWKAADVDPTVGISGHELADHAERVMRRSADGGGMWFETVKEQLQSQGLTIRGPNPGQTLVRTFVEFPDKFENVRRGFWRVR